MDRGEEAPDLLGLGRHCSVPDCGQRDFLPFTCDCCQQTFCLEHRTYAGHACRKADHGKAAVIVCPLCARAVKIPAGQDPNVVFEQHTATACDPANYQRVNQKQRCPAPGCRERLSSVNTYTCKHCGVACCLKHRFPADHACSRQPKPGQQGSTQPGVAASLRRLLHLDSAPSVVRAQQGQAAAVRQSQRNSSAARQPARPAARSDTQGGAGPEVCPVCSARFASVSDLIAHARVHQLPAGAARERCPHCAATFADAVALVEHVERQHGSGGTACVVS